MGGRTYSGPPQPASIKRRKSKAKKALDALAIAELQEPQRPHFGQNRLGDSEPASKKRKFADDDESDGSVGNGRQPDKHRQSVKNDHHDDNVEFESDNSGNAWTVGLVNKEDDSELDSDEAFGDGDDERFEGMVFRGSANFKSRQNTVNKHASASESAARHVALDFHSEGDDEFDLGTGAVDLADVLDQQGESELGDGDSDRSEHDDTEKDEEDSALSFDDEDDAIDPEKLASLQSLITNMDGQGPKTSQNSAQPGMLQTSAPSEFGIQSMRKLSVADLMPSVTDPQFRKSLKLLSQDNGKPDGQRRGLARKLDVPLPKRQQDRLDRAAAYEKSKETLGRWIETVKHNRRADHLFFPLQDGNSPAATNNKMMLADEQTRPIGRLEDTVQNILRENGLIGANGKSSEGSVQVLEDLQTNEKSLAEVEARRAELRRARDLLFREEIRARRIKKIKSKAYRKIHRKERERNIQLERDARIAAGLDDSESEKERNDRRRAEERMGARHRESRWAKGVKDSGRAKWDEDARGGVNEMARRNEELRKRMEGKEIHDGESDMSSSDLEDDNGIGDRAGKLRTQLSHLSCSDPTSRGKEIAGSSLANMDFMKKAEASRKARNDAELNSVEENMIGEGGKISGQNDKPEATGRRSFGPNQKATEVRTDMKPKESERNEFEERQSPLSEGGEEFVSFEDDEQTPATSRKPTRPKSTRQETNLAGPLISRRRDQAQIRPGDADAPNPWLIPQKGPSKTKGKRELLEAAPTISNNLVLSSAPKDDQSSRHAALAHSSATTGQSSQSTCKTDGPTQSTLHGDDEASDSESETELARPTLPRHSQQELIARAFADDAVFSTFTAEKKAVASSAGPQKKSTSLPGWGAWTGSGLSRRDRRWAQGVRARDVEEVPGVNPSKRKDAKLDRVIINEGRVKNNAKYLATQLPHPFETRAQYERSLRLPVGPEWQTKESFQGGTKPRVMVRQGIIRPMERPMA